MASYSMISDISQYIVRLLRENMVPEVVINSDSIGLCQPTDRGDIILAINLYDLKQSDVMNVVGMQSHSVDKQKYPPTYMELYYMITAFSTSDVKFRATEEQRMIGKTIQVLKDYPRISAELLGDGVTMSNEIVIEMMKLTQDEKMKLWNYPTLDYKLSLFYKVSPVEIESTKVRGIQRVTDVDWTVEESK